MIAAIAVVLGPCTVALRAVEDRVGARAEMLPAKALASAPCALGSGQEPVVEPGAGAAHEVELVVAFLEQVSFSGIDHELVFDVEVA